MSVSVFRRCLPCVAGLLVALLAGCAASTPGDSAGADAANGSSPCGGDGRAGVTLDIQGPGKPTPEEAVAPYAGAGELVLVRELGNDATVHVVGVDGHVFRVFEVTRHRDGWWPDGYIQC